MKRQLPLAITFVTAFILAVQYFIPHRSFEILYEVSQIWLQIVGAFAMVLGIVSLWQLHWNKTRGRKPGWGYSVVTLVCLCAMIIFGFTGPTKLGEVKPGEWIGPFNWSYDNVLNPLSATMFALLAYFIASAAYRAFRARTAIATILLLSAVIVMLGRVPLGDVISFGLFSKISNWLLYVPNVAAKRAIVIGVGLGVAAMSLKVMLGIERSYMGGE
jgi:hypothetical protein